MGKKYIIANWKMSPQTLAEAQGILEFTDEFLNGLEEKKELSLVFCPPFVFTEEVAQNLNNSHLKHMAELGAQDIAVDDSGALTGEISGPMLAKLGVRYVIVGHSERRWKLGESDELVNKKLKAALRNGLTPIVCLGERVREAGWSGELKKQTEATFDGLTSAEISGCMIAYEPVWAISTTPGARPDNPASASESVELIKNILAGSRTFLYGGSITPVNAGEFLAYDIFSGVLVGGASVRKEDFINILRTAAIL